MASVAVLAPCKVNLTLDVFLPRPDGFHDLDSVVVKFFPADRVTVDIAPGPRGIALTCSDTRLPTGTKNLAYHAAQGFLDTLLPGENRAVSIHLEKRLPTQAGLGGGSSDAGAVLRALCELTDTTIDQVLPFAQQIGSDVPLFLHDGPVRMRGRGETVAPLPFALPPLWGVLARPGVGVPTGPAYALLDALPDRAPGAATPRLREILQTGGGMNEIGAALHNDFEAAVFSHFPLVAQAHQMVKEAGAVRALLCGSGSTIFGLARDEAHARALVEELTPLLPWVALAEPYGE